MAVTLTVGQYIGAGTLALTFIDAQGAWITADMRENQLANVKPGDAAGILFDAVPGRIFTGRVDSVAWGIDPGRPSAGGLIAPETFSIMLGGTRSPKARLRVCPTRPSQFLQSQWHPERARNQSGREPIR